jgi:hypothetical protein
MSLPPRPATLAQPGLYVFIASGGCNNLFRLSYVYLSPQAVDYLKKARCKCRSGHAFYDPTNNTNHYIVLSARKKREPTYIGFVTKTRD